MINCTTIGVNVFYASYFFFNDHSYNLNYGGTENTEERCVTLCPCISVVQKLKTKNTVAPTAIPLLVRRLYAHHQPSPHNFPGLLQYPVLHHYESNLFLKYYDNSSPAKSFSAIHIFLPLHFLSKLLKQMLHMYCTTPCHKRQTYGGK